MYDFIWWVLGILLFIVYTYLTFQVGQNDKLKPIVFYSLIYTPILIVFLYYYFVVGLVINNYYLLIIYFIERLAWGITLKEASGEDELVWYNIIMLVPLFGWWLYRLTKIR